MKKILIIGAVIIILLFMGVLLYVMVHKPNTPVPNGNPFGNSLSNATSSESGTSLRLSDGSLVAVPNFVLKEQPEWANSSYGFEVAQDDSKPYAILFYPADSSFLISLTTEPLGEARTAAQRDLQNKLQLTTDQMCKLKVNVFTSVGVNESYAGQNLGLSYCAGSVQLPS